MKAWQYAGDERFGIADVETPVPSAGEFLVEVRASGLCHSDVGVIDGLGEEWNAKKPITLGHEIAGTVVSVGPHPRTSVEVGDRVVLLGIDVTCAAGLSRDGGYAPFVIGCSDATCWTPIPEGLDFSAAALASDAGATSQHAVIVDGQVRAGSRVGIIGLGGVGGFGARIAVLAGAEVYAAEPRAQVREQALRQWGVTAAFDDVTGFAGLDLDVIVDFAGFGTTTAGAIDAVRPAGRVVQVGLGASNATIRVDHLVTKGVTLVGSIGAVRSDAVAVLEHLGAGRITPDIEEIEFAQIGEGIHRLRSGQAVRRLVACWP